MDLYKDPFRPVSERVEDLLSRMTLEEKAAQLCGDLPASFIADGKVSLDALREKFPHGHGRFTQYSMVGIVDPQQIARISNEVQRYFVEETRLGIPVALQTENLCGYPAAGGTLFPAQINVGATWQPELAGQMAAVIGQESRAVGINSAMSPVIDVSRDPRWGRTYETYGEDPYLISRMGVEYVDVSGMMANYGEIDGICVGANPKYARTLLRDTMKFRGMLTSDGAAIMKMYNYFHLAPTYKEAGLLAKKGGLDTEIPIGNAYRQLPDYVREGKLDEALLDESVRRVLTIKFEYGLFEHPYVDEGKVQVAMTSPEKQALSRTIAEKSITLLKNDGVLPLKKGLKLAVVGPHADNLRYPISGYTYPAYIEMMKAGAADSSSVSFQGMADEAAANKSENGFGAANPFAATLAIFSPQEQAALDDLPTVLAKLGARSLRQVLADRFDVTWAEGCKIIGDDVSGIPAAVEAAAGADVIIAAMGGNCGWINVTGGEGKDRSSLGLPGVQQQLLEALCATGKPVVLVLYGPGVFALPWAARHTAAMVQAFMPGAEAGRVVADVLDGTVNPGGHLPFTVPHHIGQLPIVYNHRMGSGYNTGNDATASVIFSGGYVDDTDKPLFPFGHGLSYTTFQVSDFALSSDTLPTDGAIRATCRITNTGSRAGDQVLQLYYHFSGAHVIRPCMQLVGFVRVSLAPGESKQVTFTLQAAQLGYYNEAMDFVVEPGPAELSLGTSSADLCGTASFRLTGAPVDLMGRRSYQCAVTVE